MQCIRDEVKRQTARRRTPVPLGQVLGEVNQALRGWTGYFHHRNCSAVFARLKWSVEERMRTHLRKWHGVRHRRTGYTRFPTVHLYRDIGLFKLPTTAPWRSAHALR